MGTDMEESRRSGGNRFFGTIISGVIGIGLYWLEHQIFPEGSCWLLPRSRVERWLLLDRKQKEKGDIL